MGIPLLDRRGILVNLAFSMSIVVRFRNLVVLGAANVVPGASIVAGCRVLGFMVLGCMVQGPINARVQAQAQAQTQTQGVVVDRLLAVVNGDVVTMSDVRAARRLRLIPGAATLDDDGVVTQLIERKLMLAELARYAPTEPTVEQITARRLAWAQSLPAGTDVPKAIEAAGLRESTLMAWLRDDQRIATYLDQRFTAAAQPTREQALTYFREHEAEFSTGGVTPEFSTVEAEVRRRVAAARRAARIREWIDAITLRAEIRRPK